MHKQTAYLLFGGICLFVLSQTVSGDINVLPGQSAVDSLAKRLLGEQGSTFTFEQIPADNGMDVFEIESKGDKIIIRGNNAISQATGLNWYLKYYSATYRYPGFWNRQSNFRHNCQNSIRKFIKQRPVNIGFF